MNTTDAVETILNVLLELVAVSPLAAAGLRRRTSPDRMRLLGLSSLFFASTLVATMLPQILGVEPAGLHWNWAGKLACVAVVVTMAWLLPRETLARAGLLRLPEKDSLIPVTAFLAFCALLGWGAGVVPGVPLTEESLAFQLFMPSLAEEPVLRGILPALLSTAMGSPWKLGGARLGWWWLVTSALDALGHGFFWTAATGFEFHGLMFVLSGLGQDKGVRGQDKGVRNQFRSASGDDGDKGVRNQFRSASGDDGGGGSPIQVRNGLRPQAATMVSRTAGPAGYSGTPPLPPSDLYRRGDKSALEKLILYNLTDVANLVELAETGVGLKSRRMEFPGEAAMPEPGRVARPDSECLASWAGQFMATATA